jgi:hypothetical protein
MRIRYIPNSTVRYAYSSIVKFKNIRKTEIKRKEDKDAAEQELRKISKMKYLLDGNKSAPKNRGMKIMLNKIRANIILLSN